MAQICSLDGKYFDAVLGDYPHYCKDPLVITLDDNVTLEFPEIDITDKPTLLRVKILMSHKNEIHQHCNLLLIDPRNDTIYRYEPLQEKDKLHHTVNRALNDYFSNNFASHSYIVKTGEQDDQLPHGCSEGGLCVAYCLKEGLRILGEDTEKEDVFEFAEKIQDNYGSQVDWSQPEEPMYGRWRGGWGRGGWGGGFGAGLVGGAVLGGLAGATLVNRPYVVNDPYAYYY